MKLDFHQNYDEKEIFKKIIIHKLLCKDDFEKKFIHYNKQIIPIS